MKSCPWPQKGWEPLLYSISLILYGYLISGLGVGCTAHNLLLILWPLQWTAVVVEEKIVIWNQIKIVICLSTNLCTNV